MRVLVACEFSGVVREAFRARGHDAWSCDIEAGEGDATHHHHCDIFSLLLRDSGWDLMIAHPPCKYIANSGAKHLYEGKRKVNGPDAERWFQSGAGAEFFRILWNLPIERICVENPIMLPRPKEHIGCSQTQVIQPWQHGHGETKATCLWLKNLPPLVPTKIVAGRKPRVHHESPGPDRWKNRSRTYTGIAAAMAEQWGNLTNTEFSGQHSPSTYSHR